MPLSPHLRDRLLRHLDTLNDEKGYQLLDYVEFVSSKHGSKDTSPASIFSRFTEGVEDTLRAGKVSASAISEAMGLLNKAAGVLSGVAAAGKSVATDLVSAASSASRPASPASPAPPEPPPVAEAGKEAPPPPVPPAT
jgi:hypothetical protein